MQFSAVQVVKELLQPARLVHVLVVVEQVHVPERIDGDQRQVRLRFAQMMKRVGKLFSIGRQKVDVL